MITAKHLIDKLIGGSKLELDEYVALLRDITEVEQVYLKNNAVEKRLSVYGKDVYIRGLVEISNICKNDCYYCGIRASNTSCNRYHLKNDDILACVEEGYRLGFRTFVMQGGENSYYTDDVLSNIIYDIKNMYEDVAVTLSLGERSYESYRTLKSAGADRYLLRHETANEEHYNKLHPDMLWSNRMRCLENLKSLGYQVGCGMMVGSPYQTIEHLAKDLKFIEEFQPDMCGIGPFIPHNCTPFADKKAGSVELTCTLLSVIRLIKPNVLLPATTALVTLKENGREQGILSGANVVMPNLSPTIAKSNYTLYNSKLSDGAESGEGLENLKQRIQSIGYNVVVDRGDIKK